MRRRRPGRHRCGGGWPVLWPNAGGIHAFADLVLLRLDGRRRRPGEETCIHRVCETSRETICTRVELDGDEPLGSETAGCP